jgi:hypothetical protein
MQMSANAEYVGRPSRLPMGLRNSRRDACSTLLGLFAMLLLSSPLLAASEPAAVNISLPGEGMLLRANVPIFGSVRVPKAVKLKSWRLEYGLGPSPKSWILMKSGTAPIEKDPNEAGEVKWNPNKEPEGNLTNWATGLGSYGYGTWQQNLNGIYTLRLVAETVEGRVSEVRRTAFIGEAILRTAGGTAISADQKCRILVPPFAFGGDIGRVVAIIRQVLPTGSPTGLSGVEDTRYDAAQIYTTIPPTMQLLSPIYRIYPNGFESEPPASVELDFEAMPGHPKAPPDAMLRQYNPETATWEPLRTTWFGNTASALIGRFAQPEAYMAIVRSASPAALSDIRWMPASALEGEWVGKTSPSAQITVEGAGKKAGSVADGEGGFSVPFTLGWEPAEYRVRAVPLEGSNFAVEKKVPMRPGPMANPMTPRLTAEARYSAGEYLLIACEDKGLLGVMASGPRSLTARILSRDARGTALCELKESIPGSGMFLGRINADQLIDKDGLLFQQPMTVELGSERASVVLRDAEPPETILGSPTHPNFLFLSGSDVKELLATQSHSRSQIEMADGAWRIAGVGREPSARVVSWPIEPFPAKEWPLVGFTYRLFEQAPWQLQIRSGMDLAAYHFNSDDSADLGLPVYARSAPLIADGHWHYWQGNLSEGGFSRISGVAFGSWVKTGYRRVDPGFKGNDSQVLEIRDILIGRPSPSPNVEIRWRINDRSPLQKVQWWVDHETESQPPKNPDPLLSDLVTKPKTTEQTCRFRLPGDGRWFFHIQATDQAGNVSRIFHYPVFVFGTGAVASTPGEQASQRALTWRQPDGNVELSLRGWGSALDAKSLVLDFNGIAFPISKPLWNAGTETLTLDANSFTEGVPLGFDGELVGFRISGSDMSGNPMPPLSFPVKIQSIFTWQPQAGGGRITSSDKTGQWLATWEHPTAPWRKCFPGAVNNTLLLMNISPVAGGFQAVSWCRPIVSSDSRKLFLKESFNMPGSEWVDTLQANSLRVFDASGTLILPMSDLSNGDAWITQLTGADPFRKGRLRVTMRRGRQLEQRIVDTKELQFLLDNQGVESLRIDAWLAPGDGTLEIQAPGERNLSIGYENESKWRKTKIITLENDKQWRRVVILVEPKSTYKKTSGAKVSGNTFW